MGLIRKTVKVSTLGLAPIKANSKKERVAKAAEKQTKIRRRARAARTTRPGSRDQGVLTAAEFEAQKAQILQPDARAARRDWRR